MAKKTVKRTSKARKGASKSAKSRKSKVGKSKAPAKAKKTRKPIAKKRAGKKAGAKKTQARSRGAPPARVANTRTMMANPPHKCIRTPDGCLMFFPDKDGEYLLPPGGQRVDCAECKYWL